MDGCISLRMKEPEQAVGGPCTDGKSPEAGGPADAILAALLAAPAGIVDLDLRCLPALLIRLAAVQTAVAARLAMMPSKQTSEESDSPLDVDEASAYARCSVWTLREAAKDGRIADASKPGRSWRFTKRGLDNWIASRRGR